MKRFKKAITALSIIEKQQRMKDLEHFLNSPYFDIHPYSKSLFEYLKKNLSPRKIALITESSIAAKQPELKTKNIQDQAGTRLFNDIMHYTTVSGLLHDNKTYNIARIGILKNEAWNELNDHIQEQAKKQITKMDMDLDYYAHLHYIAEAKINALTERIDRTKVIDANEVISTFDTYYYIKKLRYLCEAHNRNANSTIPQEATWLIEKLKDKTTTEHPYIFLFVHAIQMLLAQSYTEGSLHCNEVKNYINKAGDKLQNVIVEVLDYMQSFSVIWINKGKSDACYDYLWCIDYKIDKRIIGKKNVIDTVMYYNVFNMAYRVNLATAKLQHYKTRLSPLLHGDKKRSREKFADAILEMSKGSYHNAMNLFKDAGEGEEPVFDIAMKRWHSIAMYEHNFEDEKLYNNITALQRYIERKELPELVKKQFTQFTKYAKKLVGKPNMHVAAKIIVDINKEPFFAGKEWLLQKVNAIAVKKPRPTA